MHARHITLLLTVLGVGSAVVFCSAQIVRTLTTTEGMSIAQYAAFTCSVMLGLVLAFDSRREQLRHGISVTAINQQIMIFGTWSVFCTALILTVLFRANYAWSAMDAVIVASTLVGLIATWCWSKRTGAGMKDPAVKAWNSISLKSIPQLFLGYHILQNGGAGLAGLTIAVGHFSIMVRITHLSFSFWKEGSNRPKRWLMITEVVNELSWFGTTVCWFYWKHNS